MNPSRSAASIIATPIRSLTEPPGLKNSSFATTSPGRSPARRGSATSGVLPTTAELSAPTRRVATVASVPAMRENYRNLVRFPGILGPKLRLTRDGDQPYFFLHFLMAAFFFTWLLLPNLDLAWAMHCLSCAALARLPGGAAGPSFGNAATVPGSSP